MKIVEFLKETINGGIDLDQQKSFLLEKPFAESDELAEAVEFLYSQMSRSIKLDGAVDVCGTGGSNLPRINSSTINAFIIASCGVKTAKHGNNASSGKFGSFDLLEALDVPIFLSDQELMLRYEQYNLAFLYAKDFHPAMRFFAPVRSSLNKPTFFNILGPLLSPVNAKKQIIGTSNIEYAKMIVETCKKLGKEKVYVVCGSDGLDDVTLCGETNVFELNKGKISNYIIRPEDFGVSSINDFAKISSSSPEQNVEIAKKIISGEYVKYKSELVLINSALALKLSGFNDDLKKCYNHAKKSLEDRKAQQAYENYKTPSVLKEIAKNDTKRKFDLGKEGLEKQKFDNRFYKSGLIAEIKEASPSEGLINSNLSYEAFAKIYQDNGASAISVLTEPNKFNGSFKKFSRARASTDLPMLMKDFVFRTDHIDKGVEVGANIILLIAAILDDDKLKALYEYAKDKGLQVLFEVHTETELERVLKLKPKLIGVNSRNLHDFSINKEIFEKLIPKIPKNIIKIAESGIANFGDIPEGYDGALVGTEIMKHPFPGIKVKELTGKPLLKLCGIRTVEAAQKCSELGVDLIGVNFVPRSHRRIDIDLAKQITKAAKNCIVVGIFEDQDSAYINNVAKQTGIQAVQLSGREDDFDSINLPIIKTSQVGQPKSDKPFMYIIDSSIPGSGKQFDQSKISEFEPSLIAGGINLNNIEQLIKTKKPLGFDIASGIETNKELDMYKIKQITALVAQTSYR